MSQRNYSRFQRGSGKYTCRMCKKQTRDTGHDEGGLELCRACLEECYRENAHNDYHCEGDQGFQADCSYCQKERTAALAKN